MNKLIGLFVMLIIAFAGSAAHAESAEPVPGDTLSASPSQTIEYVTPVEPIITKATCDDPETLLPQETKGVMYAVQSRDDGWYVVAEPEKGYAFENGRETISFGPYKLDPKKDCSTPSPSPSTVNPSPTITELPRTDSSNGTMIGVGIFFIILFVTFVAICVWAVKRLR